MIGTMFGPYRIERLLGRGGMGEVYRAVDTSQNDRVVALKVLSPAMSADPEFAGRFRREAHLAAGISEPHVVPVHRHGEIGGRLFLDMQLVEGRSLADVLAAEGALAPERAVAIVAQIATALDAAHADGLVHRDVKPGNVLLTDSPDRPEFAYLVDFGLALATGGGSHTALTRTGTVVGTLAYMAPERFLAQPSTPAADVYALACVLHELLTGSRPYPGPSPSAQIAGHLEQPPPRPSAVRPGLPSGLDAVVAHGMAKDPAARPRSAGDLAAAAAVALRSAPAPMLVPAGIPLHPPGGAGRPPAPPWTPSAQAAWLPPAPLPPPGPRRGRGSRGWWAGALALAAVVLTVLTTVLVATRPAATADPAAAPLPTEAVRIAMPSTLPITERTLVGRAPAPRPAHPRATRRPAGPGDRGGRAGRAGARPRHRRTHRLAGRRHPRRQRDRDDPRRPPRRPHRWRRRRRADLGPGER